MIRSFSEGEISGLARQAKSAKPFAYIVLHDILDNAKQVTTALKAQEFISKDTDLFSFQQTHNIAALKNSTIQKTLKELSSPTFRKMMNKIFNVKLQKGAVDTFGALYGNGDYLLCHDDELEGRKVAFILYLGQNFTTLDGGSLALYTAKDHHPHKKVTQIFPQHNSFAAFKVSPDSWHEVEEIISKKKRYSITGWLF